MFRRVVESLPQDPYFPHDFDRLGYFINEDDQIKDKDHPEDFYRYYVTKDQRTNDTYREAMHASVRTEISRRLKDLDLHPLYLPHMTSKKPTNSAHLRILTTPQESLRTKGKVIVIMNQVLEDLAIWSYRMVSRDYGINGGSVVSFVKELGDRAASRNTELPGIILLNPGQLLYSWKHNRSMTPMSWDAMPRKSAVHPAPSIHPVHNHVPGNTNVPEHIDFVFEKILANPEFVSPDAEIFLIGVGDGGEELVKYLENKWPSVSRTPTALALTAPLPIKVQTSYVHVAGEGSKPSFLNFLGQRARGWQLSNHPLNTPLANPTLVADHEHDIALYPLLSSGEDEYAECAMPKAYKAILDWFEEVSNSGGLNYINPLLDIPEHVQKSIAQAKLHNNMPDWGIDGEGDEQNDGANSANQVP